MNLNDEMYSINYIDDDLPFIINQRPATFRSIATARSIHDSFDSLTKHITYIKKIKNGDGNEEKI